MPKRYGIIRKNGIEYDAQRWDIITEKKDTLADDLRFFTVCGALDATIDNTILLAKKYQNISYQTIVYLVGDGA